MSEKVFPRKTPDPGAKPSKQPLSWDLLAEERIRSAQAAGEFDNLPGFGRPIPGLDQPHDELWWVKDKLRRENLQSLPPALLLRLDVQQTLARIATLQSEADVRSAVADLNERIRKTSLGACWGPPVDVLPLNSDEVLAQWRQAQVDRD